MDSWISVLRVIKQLICAGGLCRCGSVLEDPADAQGDSQCTQAAGYEQGR